MTSPVSHLFGRYGPVCGVRDGVDAADMDPPEITCRRCSKSRDQDAPAHWEGRFGFAWFSSDPVVERRDGRLFACQPPRPKAPPAPPEREVMF